MFHFIHSIKKGRPLAGAVSLALWAFSACAAPSNIETPNTAESPAKLQAACEITDHEASVTIKNLIGLTQSAEAVDRFLEQRMEALQIPGLSVAIINDHQVVYHRTLGVTNARSQRPVTPCSIFQGASITKPLFGFFVMTFVEDGVLDLDRPLYQYLPYPDIAYDERYKAITARMALTHQSGLPNWRTDFEDKTLRLQFDPGTGFFYSGEAYQYLSLVLQEIAGVDHAGLEALFKERVAKPFGMTQTQIIPSEALLNRRVDPHQDGQPIRVRESNSYQNFGAAYGVHSEAADFSKWVIGVMNKEGLSPASYENYLAKQKVPVPKEDHPLILSQDFALGFATLETPLGRVYAHDGNNRGFSSAIIVKPDQGWGLVIFSNGDQTSGLGMDLAVFLHGLL